MGNLISGPTLLHHFDSVMSKLMTTCGRFRKQSRLQRWRSFSGGVSCSCKRGADYRMHENKSYEKNNSNQAQVFSGGA